MAQQLLRRVEQMFQPKFKILLKKENFYPAEVICLGSQLITIIQSLKKILSQHIWYAANVDAFSEVPINLNLNSFFLEKIGDDYSFIQICQKIDQFLWGVFLAIDINYSNPNINDIEVSTEDEEFRSIELGGVLIEIRAFDTSFFELYTEDERIINQLAKIFDVDIVKFDPSH